MKKNNDKGTLIFFISICFVLVVLDIAVKLYTM